MKPVYRFKYRGDLKEYFLINLKNWINRLKVDWLHLKQGMSNRRISAKLYYKSDFRDSRIKMNWLDKLLSKF